VIPIIGDKMRAAQRPDSRAGADLELLGHVGRLQAGGQQRQDLRLAFPSARSRAERAHQSAQEGAHAGQELIGRNGLTR